MAEPSDSGPTIDQELQFEPTNVTLIPGDVTPPVPTRDAPDHFGRYRVVRQLGAGGFGVVYLGHDELLGRDVAIKVAIASRVATPEQAGEYLTEARLVAKLEHPAIVRVYDCGQVNDGRCYVVSQFVDGGDLARRLRGPRPDANWTALAIARLADALHHAHQARIVHRDVKPPNILLDAAGQPYLADFGLALREEDFGRGARLAGTPRYMSPEQARGEGHRVDGRSDVYSLGVVLYEMLSGHAPFLASTMTELLDQIQFRDPPPLRLALPSLPLELERICLKSLAKRASDRYALAADFAEDLRQYVKLANAPTADRPRGWGPEVAPPATETPGSTRPAKVVPKGLRAFDSSDAEFYLRLVPGPRDREGLPDSVRFWKAKLEETAPERTFAVGLLYGPSGCGKSSFVKAGLVPRLKETVRVVVVEATATGTEARLTAALATSGPTGSDLTAIITAARRGPAGTKLVLVIDQFEQWLAAHPEPAETELLRALRQCDGGRVQALLLVRDDFWMAATRLFHALEAPLLEGENSAALDLFDRDHARRVLALFGRAYNRLPSKREETTPTQNRFLDRAVDGLSEAGRVICVRLALFAEMVKGRPWEPATLDEVGGAAGVGEAFLEETFGPHAPPAHRLHAAAARGALALLLPADGGDLKGAQRTSDQLAEAAGYAKRPAEFAALLAILDGSLRLVTPTDPLDRGDRGYQLTHDYLVPSLRAWLTRRQRGTRRGRAELLLRERADLWTSKRLARYLPTFLESLRIAVLTSWRRWSPVERAMMGRAGRYYGAWVAAVMVLIPLVSYGVSTARDGQRREALADQVMTAEYFNLPRLLAEVDRSRDLTGELGVRRKARASTVEERVRLDLASVRTPEDRLAIVERPDTPGPIAATVRDWLVAEGQLSVPVLVDLLVRATPEDAPKIAKALAQHGEPATVALLAALNAPPPAPADANYATVTATNEAAARRRSRLAATLLRAGHAATVWPLLKPSADNGLRARLIHDLAPIGYDAGPLIARLEGERDAGVRRALLLALGEFGERIPNRDAVIAACLQRYRGDPDAGVHGALDWLLRQKLGQADTLQEIDDELAGQPRGRRGWVVNRGGQTFAVIATPGEVSMGKVEGESAFKDEPPHRRRIGRAYWIGSKEVTTAELQRFLPAAGFDKEYSPNATTGPALGVSWQLAAEYCNKLSLSEGVAADQLCYIASPNGLVPADDCLQRRGYRLPTEAEWEYAARAGAASARPFGTDPDLLPKYAWYYESSHNRAWPVGLLKPNDFGLFDILGNVSEWCNDARTLRPRVSTEPLDDTEALMQWRTPGDRLRMYRGGAYINSAAHLRSARRFAAPPDVPTSNVGVRLARTAPGD